MNVFTALLCTLIGIYHIGGETANKIDTDRLARVIADAIENGVDKSDTVATKIDDTTEVQQHIDDKLKQDDAVNNHSAAEKPNEELVKTYMADRLRLEVDRSRLAGDQSDDQSEMNESDDEWEGEELKEHKLVRRGWIRRAWNSMRRNCRFRCGWVYRYGGHRWYCRYTCTF